MIEGNYVDIYNVGLCYHYLNEEETAKEWTEKALVINPDYTKAKKLLKKIEATLIQPKKKRTKK